MAVVFAPVRCPSWFVPLLAIRTVTSCTEIKWTPTGTNCGAREPKEFVVWADAGAMRLSPCPASHLWTTLGFRPFAMATAATEAPGWRQSRRTCLLNSALCTRRAGRWVCIGVHQNSGGHHRQQAYSRVQDGVARRSRSEQATRVDTGGAAGDGGRQAWDSRIQRRSRFALMPRDSATAAVETPGCTAAATQSALNSSLWACRRRPGAREGASLVFTCPPRIEVDTSILRKRPAKSS
jgi:hypothetical protein